MKKHKTSKAWMHEHVTDPYVQRAQIDGYRARAAYKLLEIDERDRLLLPGMVVADLGSAPGSWSQVAAKRVGPKGRVIAIDVLEMAPIAGVEFLQGDFTQDAVLAEFDRLIGNAPLGLVMSDMAPNISGIAVSDQSRAMHLAELALDFALNKLTPEGKFLVKVFQGAGFMEFREDVMRSFRKLEVRKPKASRDRSAETYLLASNPRK